MVTWLNRNWKEPRKWFTLLLNSTHKGLKDHPKGEGWWAGFREPPPILQQAIDYYNGKEADAWDVLQDLEKAALLVPDIWRVEIVIRNLRDPYNEDPSFDMDGYIMGLLIPFDEKQPMMYFRLLAYKLLDWEGRLNGWMKPPYTIRLSKNKEWRGKKVKRKRKRHAPDSTRHRREFRNPEAQL